MSTIVTRAGKGSALTHNEVDANFVNLNTDKIEAAQTVTLTNKTISGSDNTLSNIGNASLTNSSVTIGSTSVSLGSTATTVSGLTLSSPTVSGGTINNASVGATTPSTGSFTSLTDSGNLTFTGTGNRITGDFSNATTANRVMFQNSVTNGSSYIHALPNGTATQAGLIGFNGSDANNASFVQLGATSTDVRLVASLTGTAPFLPMTFYTGGSERMRIDTSGNVGVGTGSTIPKTLTINGGTAAGFTDVLQLSSGSTANNAGPGLTLNNNYGSYATYANWQLGAIRAGAPSAAVNFAGYLAFFTNSGGSESSIAERMRIDSSGNVGIGTSSPLRPLHVTSNSAETQILLRDSDSTGPQLFIGADSAVSGSIINASSVSGSNSNLLLQTSGVERARIDANGNVGIGTSSPPNYSGYTTIAVNNATNGGIIDFNSNGTRAGTIIGDNAGLIVAGVGSRIVRFDTNGSERARIDSNGNLLVGATSQVGPFVQRIGASFNGGSAVGIAIRETGAGSGSRFTSFVNSSGSEIGTIQQSGTSAVAYVTSSDYRLKDNVQPMIGALEKVSSLKPVTYTWKADGSAGEGFIAHELAEIVPAAVSGEKDAVNEDGSIKPQGIDTSFLVATLTAAIQEQQAMIEELKAKVAALENK